MTVAPDRLAELKALIQAGRVTVDGQLSAKPAARTGGSISVAEDPNPWVSRAGLKLDHALTIFGLQPRGVALDLGASTGGFTDCLLQHGAAKVLKGGHLHFPQAHAFVLGGERQTTPKYETPFFFKALTAVDRFECDTVGR